MKTGRTIYQRHSLFKKEWQKPVNGPAFGKCYCVCAGSYMDRGSVKSADGGYLIFRLI